MKSIVVKDVLFKLTNNKKVYEDIDLIEEKILDSITFIEFFSELEDLGVIIYPTRINKDILRSAEKMQKLVDEQLALKEKSLYN